MFHPQFSITIVLSNRISFFPYFGLVIISYADGLGVVKRPIFLKNVTVMLEYISSNGNMYGSSLHVVRAK